MSKISGHGHVLTLTDGTYVDERMYLQKRETVKECTGGGPVGEPPMLKSDACYLSSNISDKSVEFILVILDSLSSSFRSFFVGVSRFAESDLGLPPLEGFVSSDSVLHRLSAELYSIVYPAISTWEVIRSRMAANEAEWSLPLSDELPEGLSDELPVGEAREVSSKATPKDINRMRGRYQIPDDVVLRIPDPDERACCPKASGPEWLADDHIMYGHVEGLIATDERTLLWMSSFSVTNPTRSRSPPVSGRLSIVICIIESSKDCPRPTGLGRTVTSLYAVIIGRGFHRRILGILSKSVVLDRPLLNSVWKERISRILDIKDHRYGIFIEPDFLASFFFGPAPNTLAQSGEVGATPVSLKCKKVDEGSSKRAKEVPSRPPIRDAIPLVKAVPPAIMVDMDLAPPADPYVATINQSPHVAMERAKGAVSSRDMDDYAAAHTEDVHYLLVHSLMRRCISVEEDLATLRAKSITDKVEMKNAKRAVEAKDKVVADLQHLVGQIKGAKVATVSEFKASEGFEDINTGYFLSGFEAFRKQAAERFPDLDFSIFQPYSDEDSVVDGGHDD
uniref:Uncharacterized protein n=1 Tax=Fagus sylvatica TaxID=28930 RepID=A0A2N9H2D6_FAGSY